jgi:hypothetical protein
MHKASELLLKGLPLLFTILGGLFLLLTLFFWEDFSMPVLPGIFSESVTVPISFVQLGPELIPIQMENSLVFQNFESLPPVISPYATLGFAFIFWFLFTIGLTLISTLNKMYFFGGCAAIIILLSFSGITGLNIGGISSNYALIFLLLGVLVPIVLIRFYFSDWPVLLRFVVVSIPASLTLYFLIQSSTIIRPEVLVAENLVLPATAITVLFLLYIGHSLISGITVFLIKLNKGLGLKISWHITIIFLLYFLLILFTLMANMGEINLPFPTFPPILLMIIAGIFGYFVLKLKIEQVEQPYDYPIIGKSFYLIGFAVTLWTWSKAEFTGNQPLSELLTTVFLYGQIALSLLFMAYLFTNFSSIFNRGTALEHVLFKPQFFAYFHMRIGAAMTLVILTIYGEGVIGVQLNTAATNLSADYYYQTGQPLEASILYENSWMQYRKNDKAKNATAHLNYRLNQPSIALEHLIESFDNAPNVPNIIFLSSELHKSDKVFDAMFYLEKGLEYFPENPYLTNNLALLYSKLNRPMDALEMIEKVASQNSASLSNKLALATKHGFLEGETVEDNDDQILKINQLAAENRKGDFASFVLETDNLPEHFVLASSLLRNQWSNQVTTDYGHDIQMLDSLIGQEQPSFEELHFRETRVLRSFQEEYINETLKYLNGLAFSFSNSAGYFHSLSANILAEQLDFEKAAIDLVAAYEKGFENFKSYHLALLYFGGKQEEAFDFHEKFKVDFPDWMKWDEAGNLQENKETRFFFQIAQLHRQVPEGFLKGLEQITDPKLKADFAFMVLIHKAHWLSEQEFERIKAPLLSLPESQWSAESLDQLIEILKNPNFEGEVDDKIKKTLNPHLPKDRNAYFTPLVLMAVNQEEDEVRKYEILQEASQFNKDPKLWILFVKQSRKIGLDNYGSNALLEMQNWLSLQEIEKLQLENF